MPNNRSMPPGDVIPELAYADVGAAAAWLCNAFGFAEHLRIADHRIQMRVGAGSIVVVGAGAALPAQHASTHAVMVRVADVDAHHLRARDAGARIVTEPQDHAFGERQYSALDLAGHRWTFSQTIADIDPALWGGALVD